LRLQAVVQAVADTAQALREGGFRAPAHLVAHQDADLIHLLPFILQAQEGADLEIAGGDVDGPGDLAPIVKVAQDLSVLVAVIDDEQLTARLAGARGHDGSIPGNREDTVYFGQRYCARKRVAMRCRQSKIPAALRIAEILDWTIDVKFCTLTVGGYKRTHI